MHSHLVQNIKHPVSLIKIDDAKPSRELSIQTDIDSSSIESREVLLYHRYTFMCEMCSQWRVMKLHDFNITSSEPRQFAKRKRAIFNAREWLFLSAEKVCETEPWTPASGKKWSRRNKKLSFPRWLEPHKRNRFFLLSFFWGGGGIYWERKFWFHRRRFTKSLKLVHVKKFHQSLSTM